MNIIAIWTIWRKWINKLKVNIEFELVMWFSRGTVQFQPWIIPPYFIPFSFFFFIKIKKKLGNNYQYCANNKCDCVTTIGGYNPIEWKSDYTLGVTKDSFIFSFKNKESIENHILNRVTDEKCDNHYSSLVTKYSISYIREWYVYFIRSLLLILYFFINFSY